MNFEGHIFEFLKLSLITCLCLVYNLTPYIIDHLKANAVKLLLLLLPNLYPFNHPAEQRKS